MTEARILGIYREKRFSPGRVADDAAILDRTAEALRGLGCFVEMTDGDRLPALMPETDLAFAMCQSAAALTWLDRLVERCPVVNGPAAIRNCYRATMLERFAEASVPQPRWEPATTAWPHALGSGPWLKRGDVHAMEAGDVRRIVTEADWSKAIEEFSLRGIERAVVQAHAEGQVYKFYGVAGDFFRAYGLPAALEKPAAALAARGARALGLEVYGGDGVCAADGSLVLIDFNDWPSFARCRDEAAPAIAERLRQILERKKPDERKGKNRRAGASGT